MVKKTINFHNPEILNNFDKKIVEEYGSVRGNRTNVLEKLMAEYISGEYTQNNAELFQLKQKVSEISSEYETLLTVNEELLTENIIFKDNIDELTKNIESLQKEIHELKSNNAHLKELLSERNERISEYRSTIETNTDTINSLNKKITVKENNYRHLEENRNKDLKEKSELENENSNYKVVIAKIEKMSLLERITKNYPDEMKALPSTENK